MKSPNTPAQSSVLPKLLEQDNCVGIYMKALIFVSFFQREWLAGESSNKVRSVVEASA